MSERTPLTHPESPWLWVMLSGGSIAFHGGVLLLLSRPALQLQPSSVTAGGNWVPITLWSATATPTSPPPAPASTPEPTPPAQTPPVPIAPQTTAPPPSQSPSPKLTPTPQATPKPNPSPTHQPTPSPQPTPKPNPSPNPTPETPENNLDNPDNSDGASDQNQTNDNAAPQSFNIGLLGLENVCQNSGEAPYCSHPVDRPAQIIQQPTSDELSSLLQKLAIQLTATVKIQTVIVVEKDGTAKVFDESSQTQVQLGEIGLPEAEALARAAIGYYRFEPTLIKGSIERRDYTIVLTITPS